MTTTLITAPLLDRARPETGAISVPAMPTLACEPTSAFPVSAHATAITPVDTTNLWPGGNDVQGTGFGKYATKRIHPGRLGAVT